MCKEIKSAERATCRTESLFERLDLGESSNLTLNPLSEKRRPLLKEREDGVETLEGLDTGEDGAELDGEVVERFVILLPLKPMRWERRRVIWKYSELVQQTMVFGSRQHPTKSRKNSSVYLLFRSPSYRHVRKNLCFSKLLVTRLAALITIFMILLV